MRPPHVPRSSLECCEPGCLAEQVQLCFRQSLFVGYAWISCAIFSTLTRGLCLDWRGSVFLDEDFQRCIWVKITEVRGAAYIEHIHYQIKYDLDSNVTKDFQLFCCYLSFTAIYISALWSMSTGSLECKSLYLLKNEFQGLQKLSYLLKLGKERV